MSQREHHLHDGKKGAALAVRVTPRASKNEIVEIYADGTVKIRLTAPPVEGKANDALVKYLAKVLDISPSKIEIVAGVNSRDKLVTILDMDAQTVHSRILHNLS